MNNSIILTIQLILKFPQLSHNFLNIFCLNQDPNQVHTLQLVDIFLRSLLICKLSSLFFFFVIYYKIKIFNYERTHEYIVLPKLKHYR